MLGSHTDALMIQIARAVTTVADSTKIGRRGLSVIAKAKIDAVHRLIPDRAGDRDLVADTDLLHSVSPQRAAGEINKHTDERHNGGTRGRLAAH